MPSSLWPKLALLALLAPLATADIARESINFDFAWRFRYGPAPSNRQCGKMVTGVDYGVGGHQQHAATAAACCDACAAEPGCLAWDWNPDGSQDCWTKSVAQPVQNRSRISGTIAPATGPPPYAQPGFDDSTWSIIDAPHDMIVTRPFAEANGAKSGFRGRGEGWYRKHFVLPADWEGSAVWPVESVCRQRVSAARFTAAAASVLILAAACSCVMLATGSTSRAPST